MAPGSDYADAFLPILGCKRRAEKNSGRASGTWSGLLHRDGRSATLGRTDGVCRENQYERDAADENARTN